jgi:hypothetical protein
MVQDHKEGPCASEYVNQVVLIYSVLLMLAVVLTMFVHSPFILPLFIGFATLGTLPSLWRLSTIQITREGFSSSSGQRAKMQQAINETEDKIDSLKDSLTNTDLNEKEANNIKVQIKQLQASVDKLSDDIDNLEDNDYVTGSSMGSPPSKEKRYPLSKAREVYDVIGGAAPANLMLPTAKNPFMNVLIDEIRYNPTRPLAASVMDSSVKVTLEEFFRTDFYSDPTDVFGKTQSQRQFVTMPSTSIPNDVGSYQNWLYKIPGKTCKEGGREACLPGTDGGAVTWLNVN